MRSTSIFDIRQSLFDIQLFLESTATRPRRLAHLPDSRPKLRRRFRNSSSLLVCTPCTSAASTRPSATSGCAASVSPQAGATLFNPRPATIGSDWRFSFRFALGAKALFSERVGLEEEAVLFAPDPVGRRRNATDGAPSGFGESRTRPPARSRRRRADDSAGPHRPGTRLLRAVESELYRFRAIHPPAFRRAVEGRSAGNDPGIAA